VRAVNLIPGEQRPGGGGPGASTGSYVVLGVLAAVVVAVAAYVLAGNTVNSRKAEVARVSAQATTTEQQAAALKPYQQFAALRQARVTTVASLAASRFDWERVMSDLARALPNDVWLTSLTGTVAPGVSLDDANSSGETGALRSAVQSPALELLGCTESQSEVSRVMARLRLLHGVTRVSLASSEKTDASGGAAGGASPGGNSSDCRNGSAHLPQFEIVVFFKGQPNVAGAAAGGSTPGAVPPTGAQPVTTPTANGAGK
jgi:Tfp pilus assembly protein PilN